MSLVCWRCGASLKEIPKPFTRLEQCRECHADLHLCRMCCFYNPSMHDKCDHELAEPTREVDLANFCQYYKPVQNAFYSKDKSNTDNAMAKLKALFGDDTESSQDHPNAFTDASSDYENAKKHFEDLFKK